MRLSRAISKQLGYGLLAITIAHLLYAVIPVRAAPPAALVQQGKIAYDRGNFPTALTNWEQAEVAYRQHRDLLGVTGSQVNQAQALIRSQVAYDRAIAALERTRRNIRVINPDAQFSLRDRIEPLYRESIDLSLRMEKLYDWLIRPAQKYLHPQTKNLVFVMDGAFQNMPVAALYDRSSREYLIDRYPVAVTPGLKILGAKQSVADRAQILIGGLTTKSSIVQNGQRGSVYDPLTYAATEVQEIKSLFPRMYFV